MKKTVFNSIFVALVSVSSIAANADQTHSNFMLDLYEEASVYKKIVPQKYKTIQNALNGYGFEKKELSKELTNLKKENVLTKDQFKKLIKTIRRLSIYSRSPIG